MKKSLAIQRCLAASICCALITISVGVAEDFAQETVRKQDPKSSKAVVKSKPEPHYPKEARKRRIEGTIVLRAIFRASGEVTDIKFVRVIPEDIPDEVVEALTTECVRVARKIKFEPAMKDGHAVSMYVQLEYNFRPE